MSLLRLVTLGALCLTLTLTLNTFFFVKLTLATVGVAETFVTDGTPQPLQLPI